MWFLFDTLGGARAPLTAPRCSASLLSPAGSSPETKYRGVKSAVPDYVHQPHVEATLGLQWSRLVRGLVNLFGYIWNTWPRGLRAHSVLFFLHLNNIKIQMNFGETHKRFVCADWRRCKRAVSVIAFEMWRLWRHVEGCSKLKGPNWNT